MGSVTKFTMFPKWRDKIIFLLLLTQFIYLFTVYLIVFPPFQRTCSQLLEIKQQIRFNLKVINLKRKVCVTVQKTLQKQNKNEQFYTKLFFIHHVFYDFFLSGHEISLVQRSSWKDVPVVVMSSENIPSRITM